VTVALRVAGGDAGDCDADRCAGAGGIDRVDLERAVDIAEVAADLGNHGVAGDEAEAAVARVDPVLAGEILDEVAAGGDLGLRAHVELLACCG
jgi:hypothetical protein